MSELYIKLENYPTYKVSKTGDVQRENGRSIKHSINSFGTHRVSLINKDLARKTVPVYRLVADAFLPNPNNHQWIQHKDGNLSNNAVTNLEWVQQQPCRH